MLAPISLQRLVAPAHPMVKEGQKLEGAVGKSPSWQIPGRGANLGGEGITMVGEVLALFVTAHRGVPP